MTRYALTLVLAASLFGAARAWDEIAAAEDARASRPEQLATILRYAHAHDVDARRQAVRALGRLERADLSDTIAQWLHDPAPPVRRQAAWSIAQSNMPNRAAVAARDTVLAALNSETEPGVIAALVEALGRLRQPDAAAARTAAARMTSRIDDNRELRLGITRGLFFLMRQPPAIRAGLDSSRADLIDLATRTTGNDSISMRTRRMATQILAITRLADSSFAARALADTDPYVRREAVMIAANTGDSALAVSVASRAMKDTFWRVRYEGLRQYGRRAPHASCDDVNALLRDPNIHVLLLALDHLGTSCIASPRTVPQLLSAVATKSPWHVAAHATVALAARDAVAARPRIAALAAHPNFFARSYAASAAGITRDTSLLKRLAFDNHPNVRTAAVQALQRVLGHGADDVFLQQLSQTDHQLLLTAAAALDSTRTPGVAAKLLDAADRMTLRRSENSRDARDALLRVAGHLGDKSLATRLTPYLNDFDPAIAARAADILKDWTGTRPTPTPKPLPLTSPTSYADALRMSRERILVEMTNGDVFTLKLLAFDAPTNAARFERMAKTGQFNGLTLHRVEPNFVVQGGSRNANEYVGAARFSRDELGIPNWRGTVGLSTRGHDTGDGQIFINTIDNELLDPFYTVFAQVVSGMDAVDRMLEGAKIKSMRVQ